MLQWEKINLSYRKISFQNIKKRTPFGFNGLGELVYMRTYSRIKEDGKNERWWETVQRVVEGTYSMLNESYRITSVRLESIEQISEMNTRYV